MAKNKKGKAKGGSKSLPHKGAAPPRKSGTGGWKQAATGGDNFASFTLRDAARFSDSRPSLPGVTKPNLRNQRMNFVSGGDMEGMDLEAQSPLDSAPASADVSQDEQLFIESRGPDPEVQVVTNGNENGKGSGATDHRAQDADNRQEHGITGTDPEISQRLDMGVHRTPSTVSSNSSDEVVVFRGRLGVGDSQATHSSASPSTPAVLPPISKNPSQQVAEPGSNATNNLFTKNLDFREEAISSSDQGNFLYKYRPAQPDITLSQSQKLPHGGISQAVQRRRRGHGRRSLRVLSDNEVDEAIYADYIANVRENGSEDNLGQVDVQSWTKARNLNGWQPSDIQDFDDMSTSEEILDVVEQVLSKRERRGGVQYLVVWHGQTVDDARWINHSSLTMHGAKELIATFEEDEKRIRDYQDQSWETDDDDDDDDEEDDDEEDLESEFEDERDLMQRRVDRMTDEQIARMLTKQEELGMGSDELLLFDQDIDDGSDEDIDDDIEGTFGFTLPSRSRGRPQRRQQFTFADGALDELGDDYGDFDVMDHDRPSLSRNKPAGRDPVAALGISDPDLEATLRTSWAADRSKKKRRKQEREELRAQGLLGKKAKVKADFSAKYKDGMSVQMFRQELEIFLEADHDTRPFPPMDKRDRKVLHHLAAGFNLKSKSQGKGSGRFTVLFKTSRTLPFDDDVFDRLSAKLERQFWPTPGGSKGKKAAGLTRSRAGGVAGWNVRDGQMVGAGAPELGVENRGRAMLEKMGWSKGNALGTVDNQGILQPIEHIVKTSKTGLG